MECVLSSLGCKIAIIGVYIPNTSTLTKHPKLISYKQEKKSGLKKMFT